VAEDTQMQSVSVMTLLVWLVNVEQNVIRMQIAMMGTLPLVILVKLVLVFTVMLEPTKLLTKVNQFN